MSRSKWKGVFVEKVFLSKFLSVYDPEHYQQQEEDMEVKKFDYNSNLRNSSIIGSFVGYSFNVHNGRKLNEVVVSSKMVGYKFGDFVLIDRMNKYVDKSTATIRKSKKAINTILRRRAKKAKRIRKMLEKDD